MRGAGTIVRVPMFWILALLLTASVTAAVVWPLLQRGASDRVGANRDVDVYVAQLTELDADLKRGVLAPAEAETARAEIGRRLLRAASSKPADSAREGRAVLAAALVLALALPVSALAFYTQTGSPNRPDLPLAARQGAEPNVGPSQGGDLATMVAAAQARLAENPQDGRGWDVLAPIYARLGDLPRAETAYRNALALMGESAPRLTGYGEVKVRAASGEVTDEAAGHFRRANELDPALLTPRLFLALDATQEGRAEEAEAAWAALLAEAPADAPWRPMAAAALAEARGESTPAGGPTQGDVLQRAAATPAGEEDAMIEGMVASLANRLAAEPRDADGWVRLVQAYGVLGDEAAGEAALETARRTFGTQTEEWARIADAGARAGFTVRSEARP